MGEHRTGRSENSGLIDLDALMRQAADSQPALPVDTAAPDKVLPRAAALPPPHPLPRAEDSLEGIVTGPRSESARVGEADAPSARRTSPEGLRPKAAEAARGAPTGETEPGPLAAMSDDAAASGVGRADAEPSSATRRGLGGKARIVAVVAALAVLGLVGTRMRPTTTLGAATHAPALAVQIPAAPTEAGRVVAAPAAPTEDVGALGVGATLDPSSLPSATYAAKAVRATATAGAAKDRARRGAAVANASANAESPATGTMVVLPASGGGAGDLGDAMRGAVGPRDEQAVTAESVKGANARQLRPSPGAVVGAINAVLPQARACLGPDDAIRSGSLVFRSDGSVASVQLQGAKDVDPCVRSALSKARVEPFADDTFTTRVTVRP